MTETYNRAHGRIRARWISGDSYVEFLDSHNMMTYSSADVLAAAYGGDTSKVPKYIGFMYGPADKTPDTITRDLKWTDVEQMAKNIGGNVQVARFNRKPSIDVSEVVESNDQPLYKGNVVEFHAVTRTGVDGEYTNDTSGMSDFAGPLESGDTIYRAVLLGDGIPCDRENKYTVLAMVDMMKNGVYRQKPASYELAVDWRVTFE